MPAERSAALATDSFALRKEGASVKKLLALLVAAGLVLGLGCGPSKPTAKSPPAPPKPATTGMPDKPPDKEPTKEPDKEPGKEPGKEPDKEPGKPPTE
jgi:hypothetical protein